MSLLAATTRGQSYKASTSLNHDSKALNTSKLLIFTTLDSKITIVKVFLRLATRPNVTNNFLCSITLLCCNKAL